MIIPFIIIDQVQLSKQENWWRGKLDKYRQTEPIEATEDEIYKVWVGDCGGG